MKELDPVRRAATWHFCSSESRHFRRDFFGVKIWSHNNGIQKEKHLEILKLNELKIQNLTALQIIIKHICIACSITTFD